MDFSASCKMVYVWLRHLPRCDISGVNRHSTSFAILRLLPVAEICRLETPPPCTSESPASHFNRKPVAQLGLILLGKENSV